MVSECYPTWLFHVYRSCICAFDLSCWALPAARLSAMIVFKMAGRTWLVQSMQQDGAHVAEEKPELSYKKLNTFVESSNSAAFLLGQDAQNYSQVNLHLNCGPWEGAESCHWAVCLGLLPGEQCAPPSREQGPRRVRGSRSSGPSHWSGWTPDGLQGSSSVLLPTREGQPR